MLHVAKITKSLSGNNKTQLTRQAVGGGPFAGHDPSISFGIGCGWGHDLMARIKRRLLSSSRREVPLTSEEVASLKEVGRRPMQCTIPDEHRHRLIDAGYIREVVRHSDGVSALALTGRGIRRLALGK
jgi:hypothetical protein